MRNFEIEFLLDVYSVVGATKFGISIRHKQRYSEYF